jgi:hypothetical protein
MPCICCPRLCCVGCDPTPRSCCNCNRCKSE